MVGVNKEKNKEVVIEINLDHGDSNRRLSSNELIQHEAYEKLKTQVCNDIEKSTDTAKEEDGHPPGNGLVYFIDGTRGAGKSTFLRSIVQILPDDLLREKKKSIIRLAYIDPSRVEDNEIILLLVLKAIKQRVSAHVERTHSLRDETRLDDFRRAFEKLAVGLSLFAPNHHPLSDLDPELFLGWGVERASHSDAFRNDVHKLIEVACDLLNADTMILAFDDAEINGKHARNVLECIRKYLDTPRLLVLVTGDMELYSLQLRSMFQEEIGHASGIDMDDERKRQRIRMLDHLEEQYLLKLFPIRRRVQLRPLWSLLIQSESAHATRFSYTLKHDSWKKPRNLESVISELIIHGLRIGDTREAAVFREFLLKQPLRSILQVLSRCADVLHPYDVDRANDFWRDTRIKNTLRKNLRESLRSVALGGLYKFGVDVDAIAADELPALIEAVFDLSVRDGDIDTGAYLRPQSSDPSLRNSFSALSSDVVNFCEGRPDIILQYMFGGPGSVSLFGRVQQSQEAKKNVTDKNVLQRQFKQYLGIGRKESALNWTRHATALFVPSVIPSGTPLVNFGVIALHRNITKDGRDAGRLTYSKAISAAIQSRELPVFALSLCDISGSNTRTAASIYNILGLIERVLALKPEEVSSQKITNILLRSYPPLSVSRAEWEGGSVSPEGSDGDNGDSIGTDEQAGNLKLKDLAEKTKAWFDRIEEMKLKQWIAPSSTLIGKIWTRLYFSLEKVSDSVRKKNAAEIMEMFALCTINAFFVEESDHYFQFNASNENEFLNRNNPLTSAAVLEAKFGSYHVAARNLPLTTIIATCPLILGLLDESKKHENYLVNLYRDNFSYTRVMANLNQPEKERAKASIAESLCPQSSWDTISRVFIIGENHGKQ